jgi:hypothetical protein
MNQKKKVKKSGRAPGDMPLPLTRLIHKNFAIFMMYAYSQPVLERLLDTKFKGEWKYLTKALFLYPIEQFTMACLELGTLLRILDEEEDISGYMSPLRQSHMGE